MIEDPKEHNPSGFGRSFLGAGMDAPLDPRIKRLRRLRLWGGFGMAGLLGVAAIAVLLGQRGGELVVSAKDITIATAMRGVIQEETSLLARVEPLDAVLISATESGQIQEIFVRDGARVAAGTPLLRLSNPERELAINQEIGREKAGIAALFAQEGQLQERAIDEGEALLEAEFALAELKTRLSQREELLKRGFAPLQQVESLRAELALKEKLLARRQELAKQQAQLRREQASSLAGQRRDAEANLARLRQRLGSFMVRAPREGVVLGLPGELGQVIAQGSVLSRIRGGRGVELRGGIDERSVGKLKLGQAARLDLGGQAVELKVTGIASQIVNGTAEIRLRFLSEVPPDGLEVGRALQVRMPLGEPLEGIIVSNSPFLETSGGYWAFVFDKTGATARRRPIRVAQRSSSSALIAEGVAAGERLIVSSYEGYERVKRIRVQ